ncbi:MAG: hypothetical protein ACPGTQ_15670 [Colwellia sp.]
MNKIIVLPFLLSCSVFLLSSCEKAKHEHKHESHMTSSTVDNKLDINPKGTKKTVSGIDERFTCLSSQSQCVFNTEHGEISISFSGNAQEGRMVSEQEFMIRASFKPLLTVESGQTSPNVITKLSGYMEGRDMFMGKIPVLFKQSTTDKNMFTGTTLTSRCAEDIMAWTLKIEVEWASEVSSSSAKSYLLDFESVSF